MTTIVQVEFRESLLSIRDDILQSLGHPVVSILGSRAARNLDLSHESVGVVLIGHGAIDVGGWHDPEEREESTAPAPRAA